MNQPIHRRLRAALALLAFAVVFVLAGLAALTQASPTITAPLATIAIVAAVSAVVVIATFKRRDESFIQTAIELFSLAAAAIGTLLGTAPDTRMAMAGLGIDTGQQMRYGRQRQLTNHRGRHVDRRRPRGFGNTTKVSSQAKIQT